MRVTVNTMYDSITNANSRHFSALSSQTERSQYRVLSAADDPVAQKSIVNLQYNISELNVYSGQSKKIESQLQGIDIQFGAFYDQLLSFDQSLADVGAGTHSPEDFKVFSDTVKGIEQDMANILNYKDVDGSYIFSGSMVDQPPFAKEKVKIDIEGSLVEVEMYVYQGNHEQKEMKSGTTSSIPITVDASKMISDENGSSVFEQLARANYYLEQGKEVPKDIRTGLVESVDQITDGFISERTSLGNNVNQASSNYRMYESMTLEYSKMLSNAQDSNIVEVSTNIQKHSQILTVINNTAKVLVEMQSKSFLG